MSKTIEALEKEQLKQIPEFSTGDTIVVQVRVKEGDRERIQAFEGVVIAKRNRGLWWSDRSDRLVRQRIEGYVAQLEPYSRTPYLFCPIGFDFNPPIPNLLELLDRYNQRHYPQSGTWVVNAGLDDYLELIDLYREKLPEVELDPNPYWTGFYTSRPALKQRCHALVERLLLAERAALALQPAQSGASHCGAGRGLVGGGHGEPPRFHHRDLPRQGGRRGADPDAGTGSPPGCPSTQRKMNCVKPSMSLGR